LVNIFFTRVFHKVVYTRVEIVVLGGKYFF